MSDDDQPSRRDVDRTLGRILEHMDNDALWKAKFEKDFGDFKLDHEKRLSALERSKAALMAIAAAMGFGSGWAGKHL